MKLIKFDTSHPSEYFEKERKKWTDLQKINRKEYLKRLINLRTNFSDFYTYNLNQLGWQAEEFFPSDYIYINKVAQQMFGQFLKIEKLKNKIKYQIQPAKNNWKHKVIKEYINNYDPQILFIREHIRIPSSFWRDFRDKRLVVCRLSAPMPKNWSPYDFDIIYTDIPVYQNLFDFNNIKHYSNKNGFDERVLSELKDNEKKYDVTFVGGLGKDIFQNRTRLIQDIANKKEISFVWWGYKTTILSKELEDTYQGITGGLQMFQIYHDSKIVLNDYINIANGLAVNQRMYEVMGVGSLLLTRYADNLKKFFPDDILVSYKDSKDCADKIQYFLKNEKERKEIAKAGQKYILEYFSYLNNMKQIKENLDKEYRNKFS